MLFIPRPNLFVSFPPNPDYLPRNSNEATFQATTGLGNYGTFPQLQAVRLIRNDLADYTSRGYLYRIQIVNIAYPNTPASFKIWATPEIYGVTGVRSFFIAEDGVIRGADKQGRLANENDPRIDNF